MSYRKRFIDNIKDGAIEGWKTHKILPSVSIAQGILESNWGRSALAKNANNLFGIKGSYKGQSYIIKTWEHINGKDITVDAAFRKYPNWDDSLVDHAEFFVSTAWRANNYKNVIGETDYKKATKALSDAGYATDPNYADKLNNIIETYNLMEYDKRGVKKMAKIYIDPGHGGHDSGASGSGLVEKQWVLEVSLELARILRGLGHSVRLSRTTDVFIGLAERSRDANRWGADIFISVHFNAGGGYGWEDFIFNGTVSNNTKKLQNDIHEAIKPVLTKHGMRNRGKKTANFSVLRQTNAPSILIEGGFVDTTDNAIMKKASFKKDVAVAMANGVQKYFGLSATASGGSAEWVKNATGWWYRNADGSYPKTEWKSIGGKWYYFNARGYMQTGWTKVGTKWYYMNNNGHMQTGWQKVGDTWYYLASNGAMVTGWQKVGNTWYYLASNGAMQTGWTKVGTKWYYMNKSGAMQTGLVKIGSNHFYLQDNGAMVADGEVKLKANKSGHLA